MRNAVKRLKKNNNAGTFTLQLTSMVDMFTILIVFLLKSFSTSAVHITPHEGMKLPMSSSYENPIEAVKLIVAYDGIYVEDKKVIPLEKGELKEDAIDSQDSDFINVLFKELDLHAKKALEIKEINTEAEFDGKIVMQADERLDYSLLKKVMYTSSMAGYAEMKLATISFE